MNGQGRSDDEMTENGLLQGRMEVAHKVVSRLTKLLKVLLEQHYRTLNKFR